MKDIEATEIAKLTEDVLKLTGERFKDRPCRAEAALISLQLSVLLLCKTQNIPIDQQEECIITAQHLLERVQVT